MVNNKFIIDYICLTCPLALQVECSLGFNPGSNHAKDSKMALDSALLNTQCVSRLKWSNPEKEVSAPQHLSAVANEKGTFGYP